MTITKLTIEQINVALMDIYKKLETVGNTSTIDDIKKQIQIISFSCRRSDTLRGKVCRASRQIRRHPVHIST